MTTRATRDTKFALIKTLTLAAGQTAAIGLFGVRGDQATVSQATAGGPADVVFLSAGTAGQQVQCAELGGGCILPAVVGAAGVTAGTYVENAADGTGIVSCPAFTATGTHLHNVIGRAVDSGVQNDVVGFVPCRFVANAAS